MLTQLREPTGPGKPGPRAAVRPSGPRYSVRVFHPSYCQEGFDSWILINQKLCFWPPMWNFFLSIYAAVWSWSVYSASPRAASFNSVSTKYLFFFFSPPYSLSLSCCCRSVISYANDVCNDIFCLGRVQWAQDGGDSGSPYTNIHRQPCSVSWQLPLRVLRNRSAGNISINRGIELSDVLLTRFSSFGLTLTVVVVHEALWMLLACPSRW